MDYHILREFADSWALLSLVGVFLVAVVWAFRPGSRKAYEAVADIPFRHEDKPASQPVETRAEDGATL